jgi:hypothetical protein
MAGHTCVKSGGGIAPFTACRLIGIALRGRAKAGNVGAVKKAHSAARANHGAQLRI